MPSRRDVLHTLGVGATAFSGCGGRESTETAIDPVTDTLTESPTQSPTDVPTNSPTDETTPTINESACEVRWKPTVHWSNFEDTGTHPPATAAGRVFFSADDNRLRAIEIASGRLLWEMGRYSFDGRAVSNGSAVAVPDSNGMAAFSLDGAERWRVEPPGEKHRILSRVSDGSTLYTSVSLGGSEVPSDEEYDRIYAFDWETGEPRWVTEIGDPEGNTPANDLAVGSNRLYVAITGGYTVALSLDSGKQQWSVDFSFGKERLALADNVLVRVADEMYGLSLGSGRVRWQRNLDGEVVARERVYAESGVGVSALDPSSGKPVWRSRLPENREIYSLTLVADTLYVYGDGPDVDRRLYALDTVTGCRRGSAAVGHNPVPSGDRLVVTERWENSGICAVSRP